MTTIPHHEIQSVVSSFGKRSFSTYDFIVALKKLYPATMIALEAKYGPGGAGSGNEYSAYSRVAHALNKEANIGALAKLDYRPAPSGWGSPVIRYWASGQYGQDLPNEILQPELVVEGAKKLVFVNKYERDSTARLQCIDKWGVECTVCGFDFEKKYGSHGAGYIHVHHLKPLNEI